MGDSMQRVLVTGGAGFVGHWVIRALRTDLPGAEIINMSHCGAAPPDKRVIEAKADIANRAEVDAVVRAYPPSAVIHLAAIAAPGRARQQPERAWAVNVFGTWHVAEAVLRHAPDALFVFVGSSEVYGATHKTATGALREEAPLAPLNTYATTKAAADLLVGQLAHEGLRCLRFRPFNHTGPGQSSDYVVAAFARQIARIERGLQPPVVRVGNLDAERDFLDVRDVAAAYVTAVVGRQPLDSGSIFNLASGQAWRIGDMLQALIDRARVRVSVEIDPQRLRPVEIKRAVGDATRAKEMLHWSPRFAFEATLADVLEDWRGRVAKDDGEAEGPPSC